MCLNARSIVNEKNQLNIVAEDIDPRIIEITESRANKKDAELGLAGYVMFRKEGDYFLYIKDSIQA